MVFVVRDCTCLRVALTLRSMSQHDLNRAAGDDHGDGDNDYGKGDDATEVVTTVSPH